MPKHKYNWSQVEREVIYSSEPIDYQKISQQYDIPAPSVRKRASNKNWRQRHAKFNEELDKEVFIPIEKKKVERNIYLDRRANSVRREMTASILTHLNKSCYDKQQAGTFTDLDAVFYGKALKLFGNGDWQSELEYHLHWLADYGLIPYDSLPQILHIIDNSEADMNHKIAQAIKGVGIPD